MLERNQEWALLRYNKNAVIVDVQETQSAVYCTVSSKVDFCKTLLHDVLLFVWLVDYCWVGAISIEIMTDITNGMPRTDTNNEQISSTGRTCLVSSKTLYLNLLILYVGLYSFIACGVRRHGVLSCNVVMAFVELSRN